MTVPGELPSQPLRSDAPAWYHDLSGRHEARFWNGTRWTADVMDRGVRSWDPTGSDEEVHIDLSHADEPVARPTALVTTTGHPVVLGLSADQCFVLCMAIVVAVMWIALTFTRTTAVVVALTGG
jgi:hypothetical protein